MSLTFSSSNGTSIGLIKHAGTSAIFDGATQLTFSLWAAPLATIEQNAVFVKYAGTSSDGFLVSSIGATNRFAFSLGKTGAGDPQTGYFAYVPTTGLNVKSTYDHFAIVFNGDSTDATNSGRLKIFVNGSTQSLTFINTISSVVLAPSAGQVMQVGNTTSSGIMTWDCAHLMIYNRALSSQEIAIQMIRRLPLDTTSLVFWAPYDDGLAFTDLSPNKLHGTTTMSGGTVAVGSSNPSISYGHPVPVVM